ncbi:MAG TPA: hypothetical protein VGK05_07210, partial [Acidimicrobiia bacterium]
MNPRREASERVHGAYEVRVLEPSPPPVTDRLWFADDPVARGESPAGAPIVSPVTTGDLTWDELCRDAPELAGWCADRWLGAWRPLPPLPARDAFAPTRAAWHTLAEHVLARARYDANGKIGLRYTRRGVGTPWFRHRDRDAQVRIEGTNLVVHEDGETRSAPLTTVAAAAELARIQPGAPEEVYAPATTLERDAPLVLDARSVEFFGAWFGFAASVLEQIRAEADPVDEPSRVQLWPEHFDLSVDLGDENAGHRGTFGASPGDDVDRDPYLYVTHWADVGADDYWDEEHFPGASLTVVSLAAAPDQRASALTFLRRGR